MHFNRLRLNGFKSFVDPTDLIIQDGLTGVVGPNGCGKSNLLEALRWVMGENRPTAMRGGGMEDVIFAGAATRGARNFAEVVLQIDNSQRLAPAGFNDEDTLDITRRITRDAGSAYKLNGKDVRARDVQMLFADASTGAHSPALVRQGQISELINAKPKARRRVLEEAAGISGLYQRRHEAELKLKGAETNLARVEDVLEQLASQLASLARQARQAQRYREIGAELRQAEGLLLYLRWRDAQEGEARAEAVLREALTGAARAETAAREAATAREAAEGKLPPLREEEAIAGAVLQRLLVERDSLDGDIARAREAVTTLEGRLDQLSRDIDREGALNADAGDSIAALEEERHGLQAESEGHDEALATALAAAEEAATVLRSREQDLTDATEEAARLAARHQSAERREV
ncbi:AAA family ATPase, partial [Rhodobacterales bacterium HKCCSP123]|nr:AAA family ATPase [Rhodobacterales bacterium HKCCSP123]